MISPLRYLEIYMACTLHFKEGKNSYDFFKYQGKTRTNADSLLKRKDKYFFERAAAKSGNDNDAIIFTFSNIIKGNTYVRNFDWKNYQEWLSYCEALYFRFEKDVYKYSGKDKEIDPVEECFAGSTDAYNYLVIANEISNGYLFKRLGEKYEFNILWEDLQAKLLKYRPFVLNYMNIEGHKQNLREIVNKRFA